MTTLLQFVLAKVLGEPTHSSNGVSYWACPRCDSDSFHTLPHKPPYKDRARCYSCDLFEDVLGVVHELFPSMSNFNNRLDLLAQLQKEFRTMPRNQKQNAPALSPRGEPDPTTRAPPSCRPICPASHATSRSSQSARLTINACAKSPWKTSSTGSQTICRRR